MQNPNRFIKGLSDLSDIVDLPYDDGPDLISSASSTPISRVVPLSVGSGSSLVQFESLLTKDGTQTINIGEYIESSSMLFVNGFIQSKTAYTISGNSLILPSSLNVFAGDLVILVYVK